MMLDAERLQFLRMRINENLELGSNATVVCRAEGRVPPRLRWSRLDDDDDGELPDDVYADDAGHLYFVHVRASHAGQYECVAASEQGTINVTVRVDVVGASCVHTTSASLHPPTVLLLLRSVGLVNSCLP